HVRDRCTPAALPERDPVSLSAVRRRRSAVSMDAGRESEHQGLQPARSRYLTPGVSVLLCRSFVAVAVLLVTRATDASCGSASCSLMTDRFAQTTGSSHVGWSADMRVEAVTADRLRSGTSTVSAGEGGATHTASEK